MMETRKLTLIIVATVAVLLGVFAALPGGIGGGWPWLVHIVADTQRALHAELATAVKAVRDSGPAAQLWLIGLSFLYGVFHAAGPGHGKVVISTYLLTHESQLKRGIGLAFASSFVQGLTALAIVWIAVGLLGWAFRDARGVVDDIEVASFALVGLLGFALMVAAGRRLFSRWRTSGHAHSGDSHACGTCGHSHGIAQQDLDKSSSWAGMAAVVLAVGIRPCSGGVLVLLFAHVAGVPISGAIAVMAMSLGTAATVSTLAALAVHARRTSLRLADALPEDRAGRVSTALDAVAFAGGGLVLALGISLVGAALQAPAHPLF